MARIVQVKNAEGKKILNKEESENLRGNIVVLNPENSEIAKHLKISEKGSYSMKA